DVTHTWISDLLLQVFAPNGNNSRLVAGVCNVPGGVANLNKTFSDNAGTFDCSNSTTGTAQPVDPLNPLGDNTVDGTWQIAVADFAPQDTGTFNSWSIELCSTTFVPLSNNSVDLSSRFTLYPNPAKDSFQIGSSAFTTGESRLTIYDLSGRAILSREMDNNALQTVELGATFVQGLYIVELETQEGKSSTKLLVE
ncbi:MAG: T9SS type A sorting domain-containing protein, partial [Nonlabens sp.]